jgi:hypothetical protein
VGCVTALSDVEVRARLEQVSREVKQRRAKRTVVPVYAATRMEAWVHYAEAKNDPESSPLSLQLARAFAHGNRLKIDYFVGGPYAALADRVVLNALSMNTGPPLPGLRIVLVSSEEPTPELRAAARARSAKLEHYPLP